MNRIRTAFFIPLLLTWVLAGCATTPKKRVLEIPQEQKSLLQISDILKSYKKIVSKRGWPVIPEGPELQKGDKGKRVAILRRRLVASRDLEKGKKKNLFDDQLEAGVRHFQERHGLEATGRLDAVTMAKMNVPLKSRIRQLEINKERWQLLVEKLGKRYVIVNIPDYRLKVVEGGIPVLRMNVVVGQAEEWQTPTLNSSISYLILNPKWNVPPGIFEKEMLAHLQKDPSYLEKEDMKVVGNDGEVMDPSLIDWDGVDPKNPKLRIVQAPGERNALGKIKFMFPNPYAIYLHDTPQKKFFSKKMRALSHGCIRIEKPMSLASYLIRDNRDWSIQKIKTAIKSGQNQSLILSRPVELHIVYLTAWVDEEGVLQIRDDVYGLDQ